MSAPSTELAARWLQKADNDLVTARQTLLLVDGPTDTVAFHAQQAIEKAVKAFLTFQKVEFPKIHDLVRLLDLVSPRLPELEEYRAAFAEISNYSVQARYPDEFSGPTRDEAVRSVAIAEDVVAKLGKQILETP